MRTLYLLRHAKSSRDDASLPDRERPLEARGEHDAALMSKRWAHRLGKPDLIISSPALRARATARIVAEGLGYKPAKIVVDARLYAATTQTLISVLEALDDKVRSVMLVGHNPEFTELARRFDADIVNLPTCALAEFDFAVHAWSDIGRARPAHARVDSPKS